MLIKISGFKGRGGRFAVSDEDAADVLGHSPWCLGSKYIQAREGGGFISLHYWVVKRLGLATDGLTVDHINGDVFDNRRENLQILTDGKNKSKRRKRNDGVFFSDINGWYVCGRLNSPVHGFVSFASSEQSALEIAREVRRGLYVPAWRGLYKMAGVTRKKHGLTHAQAVV